MTQRLALLQNLANTLGLNTYKTVNITPDIFKNTYKNFEISITSTPSQ